MNTVCKRLLPIQPNFGMFLTIWGFPKLGMDFECDEENKIAQKNLEKS